MTRQEMIDLIGWHYQTMTAEEKNILSRVEHIVEVSVLREREACAKFLERGVDMAGLAGDPVMQKYTAELLIGCAAAIRARKEEL